MAYVIKGDNKSLLIDCGVGLGNIREYIKTNLKLDIDTVLLTHGHIDYIGGCSYFANVHMNKKDMDLFMSHYNKTMQKNHLRMNKVDPDVFVDSLYAPLDVPNFNYIGDTAFFDLGNISLEITNVPSHTQGEIVIYVPEEKILITGDACNNYIFMFSDNSCFVSDYKKNLELLYKKYKGKFDRVLVSHEPGEEKVDLITNVINLCEDIIMNKCDDIEVSFFWKNSLYCEKN